jgi:hypothetical protein
MQFMVEEAAAVCLELHEAQLAAAAHEQAAPPDESDVRSRHRKLLEQAAG